MGLQDREYMRDRYLKRGGAMGVPIWRERHARMELEDENMRSLRYADGSSLGSRRYGGPRSAGKSNVWGAAALGVAVLIYVIVAQPFGDLIDLSGLPKNGEFRVRAELMSEPTGMLRIQSPDDNIAVHLIDEENREVFVGFVREGEIGELPVPAGRWHAVVTSGTADSLRSETDLRMGRPLGTIDVAPGQALTAVQTRPENVTHDKQTAK